MERQDDWLEEIKRVIVIGGIVSVFFVLAIIIGFIFFPYDVDGAAYTLIIATIIGAIIAISLLVKRTIYLYKRIRK